MKTSIVRTDVWKDEDLYQLHLDSKYLYLFILSSPERGISHIMPWNKRFVSMYTGLTSDQLETAVKELTEKGFVDVYSGYIAVLKEHLSVSRNRYSEEHEAQELADLPEDVRAYFIDKKPMPPQEKPLKKKKEPKPDEVKALILQQPELLQQPLLDFAADRVERKKPATTGAVKRWLSKLETMYPGDLKKQVASIEQSIERGWSGMYEVKENKYMKPGEGDFL